MSETVVGKDTPALTVSGPSTGTVGSTITVGTISATLSSGTNPTGTVTFTVFGPETTAPTTCTSGGTPVGTSSVSGNNSYNPTTGFTPTSSGNYWRYASVGYCNGTTPRDSPAAPGHVRDRRGQAHPAVSATGPATGTAGTAMPQQHSRPPSPAGLELDWHHDLHRLRAPGATPISCTTGGTTVGTSPFSGNNTYHPSAPFTPTAAGNYWWYASYGGDGKTTLSLGLVPRACPRPRSPRPPYADDHEPLPGRDGTTIAASFISAALGPTSGSKPGGTMTSTVFGPQQPLRPPAPRAGPRLGRTRSTGTRRPLLGHIHPRQRPATTGGSRPMVATATTARRHRAVAAPCRRRSSPRRPRLSPSR